MSTPESATLPPVQITGLARSLANLRPPWQKGIAPNPKGRPNAGAAVMEWINLMRDWDQARIEAIRDDKAAPINRVIAARWLIDAASQNRTKGGTPVAAGELDRLLDRTLGKPVQQVTTTSTSVEFTFDLGRLDDAGETIAALPVVQDQGVIDGATVQQTALPLPSDK